MFNLTAPRASSDVSNPVNYVDTSYEALKYNAPATQQLLQAAQQGQPVGLAGIGAMAAQKFQQNAQTAQQQQNAMQQMPSPTVLSQIVNSGIMSQLQPSIQMAQAPSTPMEPQQMAIGGVVALNDGGFVDYSYDNGAGYAGGGELRGFAGGDEVALDDEIEKETEAEYQAALARALRGTPPRYPIGEATTPRYPDMELPIAADVKGPAVTYADIPIPSDVERKPKARGFFDLPEEYKARMEPLPSPEYWQRPGADVGRAEISKGLDAILNPFGAKIDEAKQRWKDRYRRAEEEGVLDYKKIKNLLGTSTKPVNEPETPLAQQDKVTTKAELPEEAKNTDKGSEYKSPVEVHSEQDAQPRREAGVKGAQLASASATSIPGLEPIPAEVERENAMSQIREAMRNNANPPPSASPAAAQGINTLPTEWDNAPTASDYEDQLEMLQRIYQGDRTGKLSPEIASRMAAMEDQATRDKWLGALTGFGAGLFGADTPYMSQAIASGALMGLSNYQRGAQNEEQTALRRLQAEAAAEKEPEEARQKAISTYMQAQLASGKSAAELRKELLKQQSLQARDVYKAGAAKERAQIIAHAQAIGLNAQQAYMAADKALKRGDELVEVWSKEHIGETISPAQEKALRDQAQREVMAAAAQMMGGSNTPISGMSSGTGLGGRPIIMNTSGQLINR